MYQLTLPTFTRTANGTAYTAGDLVCNSTTPASVVLPGISRRGGGPLAINKFTLVHSQRTTTSASWQVLVVDAQSALALGIGDNDPLTTAGSTATLDMTKVRGVYAGNSTVIGPSGAYAELAPIVAASRMIFVAPVSFVLVATAAYGTASAETFTLSVDFTPHAP